MDVPVTARPAPPRAALLLHWHALRPFVESFPASVLLVDAEGDVVAANRGFGRPFDEMPGARFLDLFSAATRDAVACALAEGRELGAVVTACVESRAGKRHVEMRVGPAPDGGAFVVALDG